MSTPAADHSVRVAWTDDADAIARLQVRTWPSLYGDLVSEDALPHDVEALADVWRRTLAAPGDARRRVLVALDRHRVVGLVLTGPATDPDRDPVADGELTELTVDPDHRRLGHGSRLLQAAVDTLVADRFSRAVTWVNAHDDALREFLLAAGWGADGAHRELALGEDVPDAPATRVKQVRLHTEVA